MGSAKSKAQTTREVILVGLEGSGKTTTLMQAMHGTSSNLEVAPTVGYAQEHLKNKFAVDLVIRDFGGSKKYRNLWTTQYHSVHGIIFVVDAADADRLPEAVDEFKTLLSDKILAGRGKVVLLILANKSDLPQAMEASALAEAFGIDGDEDTDESTVQNFDFKVVKCSALKGAGIADAFVWLSTRLKKVGK